MKCCRWEDRQSDNFERRSTWAPRARRFGLAALAAIGVAFAAHAQERTDFHIRCDATPEDSCQWGSFDDRNLDGKDLTDSNYKAIHMRHASLRGATLERVNLQVADVSGSDFSQANLVDSTLFAANAQDAKFVGADLRGVNLTRANLAGANLSGAKIDAKTYFIGTRLGSTVWLDGRVCAAGSIGKCD